GEGRPVAVARGTLLERRLLERNRRTEILAERNARADPHTIQEGSSAAAAAADADFQGAVTQAWRAESSRFRRRGATTCCEGSTICAAPAFRRTHRRGGRAGEEATAPERALAARRGSPRSGNPRHGGRSRQGKPLEHAARTSRAGSVWRMKAHQMPMHRS